MGALAAAAALALVLAACGEKKEGGATQVAAKVNGDEITVHQINFILSQQRNLRPEQAEAAQKQILDRLIDEQIEVQKAEKMKLDRDPQTVQMLEAAKREILARRYVEVTAEKGSKPADADVRKYFDDHPALFTNRKVYTFDRLDVQCPPDKRQDVITKASGASSDAEVKDWLTAQGLKFNSVPMKQPADALPLPIVDQVAKLSPGQSLPLPQQYGVAVLVLQSAEPAPVGFDESREKIERFLSVDTRRKAVADLSKSLRQDAKIEYVGKFAPGAAPATPAAAPASDTAPAAPPPAASPASSGMDAATLQKGLGLK